MALRGSTQKWLLLLGAGLVLVGCRPVQVKLDVRSERRLDASITAVTPERDRELAEAALRRFAPGDWKITTRRGDDGVTLRARRRVNLRQQPSLVVDSANRGFPWLLVDTSLRGSLTAPPLEDNHPLAATLKDVPVDIVIDLPGRVRSAAGGQVEHGAAVYHLSLADLSVQPLPIEIKAVGVRWLVALTWLLLAAFLLWLFWPWLRPPAEVRAERRARNAERRAAKNEQRQAARQAKQAKDSARQAAAEAKAAQTAEAKPVRLSRAERRAAARAAGEQAAREHVAREPGADDGTGPAETASAAGSMDETPTAEEADAPPDVVTEPTPAAQLADDGAPPPPPDPADERPV